MDTERLLNDLRHEPPGPGPGPILKVEFERKQKRLLIQVFVYLVVGLAIMYAGAMILQHADETRGMVWGAVIVLIGFEITILIKLAYGNMLTALRTDQTVKEMHLDLVERLEQARENGRDEQ